MGRRVLRLAAGTAFLLAGAVRAAGCDLDDRLRERFERGRLLLEEAQLGSEAASRAAREALAAVVAAAPACAAARVRLGLALVLEARDAPLPRKRALAERGFGEMDAAVASAPGDPEIRLVRAVNAYQMPLLLGRREIAAADFARLREAIAANDALGPALRRRILFHAGAFALKEGRAEALSLLEAARSTPAGEPSAEVVQSMLALARLQFTPPSDAQAEGHAQGSPP